MTGLRAPGGFASDRSWKDGNVDQVRARSLLGRPLRLRRGDVVRTIERTSPGAVLVFTGGELTPATAR